MSRRFIFLLGAGLIAITGCVTKESSSESNIQSNLKIQGLEDRIQLLEKKIKSHATSRDFMNLEVPTGPIKSITFRIGTKDDRLRIYWANGNKSDLPCTKEQLIWVCG